MVLGDGGGSGGGPWRPLGVDCARRQRCLERSWALAALDATRRLLCWAAAAITLCVSRARWYDLGVGAGASCLSGGSAWLVFPRLTGLLHLGRGGGERSRLRVQRAGLPTAFCGSWPICALCSLCKAQLAPLLLQPREPL